MLIAFLQLVLDMQRRQRLAVAAAEMLMHMQSRHMALLAYLWQHGELHHLLEDGEGGVDEEEEEGEVNSEGEEEDEEEGEECGVND